MPKKNYSRLEVRAWREYFVRLDKTEEVPKFRKWLRENMVGPFKAEVTFMPTYDIAQCYIRDDDDAILFILKWSPHLA